ncbi:MAG: glutaredoxin family protein [Candidatus Thiodiazotropha sp. (ex Semelilucina semeliformis)]|nr:glutaredoxin family protein [Candidatus Thiodiazotropha sp. (ex Semelilucina semeliformis)]
MTSFAKAIILPILLLVSPAYALDLGGMFENAVRSASEKMVEGAVDSTSQAIQDAFPSLPEGVVSIDKSQVMKTGDDVVMYETDSCGYCVKARRFFKKNNVSYTSRNVAKSSSAKKEFKKLGGRGVPVILVKDQKLTGWSESKLRRMLKDAGYL